MRTQIQNMTGDELLLLAVLGGPAVQARVDAELDRRALFGPPTYAHRTRTPRESAMTTARDGLLVA